MRRCEIITMQDLWALPVALAFIASTALPILITIVLVERACESPDYGKMGRTASILLSHPHIVLTTAFLLPFVSLATGWLSVLWFAELVHVTPSSGFLQVGTPSILIAGVFNVLRLGTARRHLEQKTDDSVSHGAAVQPDGGSGNHVPGS